MERAILADKKNPVPMYHKANILMSLDRFDEALEVLEELKEYAPRESSVYALMGKIYKRRNMHQKAMLHYGMALDLKPSATDAAAIKVIPYDNKSFALKLPSIFAVCFGGCTKTCHFFFNMEKLHLTSLN